MSTTTQKKAPSPKQLFDQQPDPLTATADEVEQFIEVVQLRSGAARETADRVRLRREALSQIELAGLRARRSRSSALEALDRAFRLGKVPQTPLDGFYRGLMVAPALTAVIDPLFTWLTNLYLPWLGKRFNAADHSGDNIVDPSARKLLGLLLPGYKGLQPTDDGRYAGFKFRTYAGVGRLDSDRHTLSLDYDSKDNPAIIRRVVDELVEIVPGTYLGKMMLKGRSSHRLVAYFAVTDAPPSSPA